MILRRIEDKEYLENKKYTKIVKDSDETCGINSKTSAEAVGMEKLIPSLRQRQQFGKCNKIHHSKVKHQSL